jgi:ribose 5-phosphate isomerase A
LTAVLAAAGYANVPMSLRQREGATFKTDGGNVIYDIAFGAIQNAPELAMAISAVPGVVEHGLFIGIATTLLLAGPGGVDVIERRK